MDEYDVVILPSFAEVETWRKREAGKRSCGLFSQTVTTFDAWIADLWELHGDGSEIIGGLQRQVVMRAAFDQAAGEHGVLGPRGRDGFEPGGVDGAAAGLRLSAGVVKLAARCVCEAAGLPSFERAVDAAIEGGHVDGLDGREAALLRGIGVYREMLCRASLVEFGRAAALLAACADEVFPRPLRVLVAHAEPLNWICAHFFASCAALEVTLDALPGASGLGRVPRGVDVRFGFPSGRYAQPALVADVVSDALSAPAAECAYRAVIAARDPLALGEQLERSLTEKGVRLDVQGKRAFASTDFGRCFLSLCRAVDARTWSAEELSDAAASPFSGFTRGQALAVDAQLRADRLVERESAVAALRSANDTFSQLEEIATDPDADILVGVFEQIAFTSPDRTDAWRCEQLAALRALRSCTSIARAVGAGMGACAGVLEEASIQVSYESSSAECDDDGARILVTTQGACARLGAASCETLVLCDLTAEDYPIADKDEAGATLFGKLGLHPVDSALAHARRVVFALEQLPTRQMVCVRPLNDWEGNPTYPAAVLQELIDAYRLDATSDDDLDEVYGLPTSLLEGMVQRGEELLFANAVALDKGAAQVVKRVAGAAEREGVSQANVAKVALGRAGGDGRALFGFSPSPSQVETYLDCPRKWFVQSRLKVDTLDEGFGALERGSFAHAVLQEFYKRFQERGHAKVSADTLPEARLLMREVADQQVGAQRSLEPKSGRYVAATQMERRELEMCIEQLVAYLDFEARLLPSYRPAYLEYAIRPEDGITYAHHPFIGTVDRIDVDDAGNAVIIDYKGSITGAHEIAGKTPSNPGKVQARMYAQVVSRMLGLNVVGALYVSYGKSHGCAGALDARAIDVAHVPDMKADRCRCALESDGRDGDESDYSLMTFADMLDATESLVEAAMASMEAGDVVAKPASSDSCAFCPVANCSKRGA